MLVLTSKLLDVTVKMLGADLVERAFVGALEHRPERLNAIRMGHAVHVLTDAVTDALVLKGHALVGRCIVCVNLGIGRGVLGDKSLQSPSIRIGNNLCCYLIAVTVLHSNHGCFAGRSTSGASQLFALGLIPTCIE